MTARRDDWFAAIERGDHTNGFALLEHANRGQHADIDGAQLRRK